MTELPILFSTPMVRAILDGKKTQTRRAVNPQPEMVAFTGEPVPAFGKKLCAPGFEAVSVAVINQGGNDGLVKSPYGMTGGRLWVRETWAVSKGGGRWAKGTVLFRADHGFTHGGTEMDLMRWKPSIFMPREACRLTLEITSIRVERVQDIDADDCVEEGIPLKDHKCGCEACSRSSKLCPATQSSLIMAYRDLWDSLNAKRDFGWDANPWAWVLTFKVSE